MNKKIWFSLIGVLMLIPISFTSCSDDDEEIGFSSLLVGTWESVSFSYQIKENGKVVDKRTEDDNSLRGIFNEDGTWNSAEYYNGTWHYNDEIIWTHWSYKNGKIITESRDCYDEYYSESVTVKELTASKLVVESVENYTDDGISYEDYALIEYRKISE